MRELWAAVIWFGCSLCVSALILVMNMMIKSEQLAKKTTWYLLWLGIIFTIAAFVAVTMRYAEVVS